LTDDPLDEQKTIDPTVGRRKQIKKQLAKLKDEREALQEDLIRWSKERKLDRNTEDRLTKELKEIESQEQRYNSELQVDDSIRREWEKSQIKLERLHQKCIAMQEKLKDSNYQPTDKDKRDMIEFFGITAILWEKGHKPRRKIQGRFDDIVLPLR